MKRILYISFYFEPDLCAGSFRNSPLAVELANQLKGKAEVEVITTMPNRYSSFSADCPEYEQKDNLTIRRILLPKHKSGFLDQVKSFKHFYFSVKSLARSKEYDLVFASSSRLFSAYLGYKIAKKNRIPLYLDIRDIFVDTINDVLSNKLIKIGLLPILKAIEKKVFNYAIHINLISAGFESYFKKFPHSTYSYFTNGIDEEFVMKSDFSELLPAKPISITYAGNLGEGQGLHKIIPEAAELLGSDYLFRVIGDGGTRKILEQEIQKRHLKNVQIIEPVKRIELIEIYKKSHYLLIHLNDYKAFEKVLPSKVFELGAFPRPILAGVGGYAFEFIKKNISNSILFKPLDAHDLVSQLKENVFSIPDRKVFISQFKRSNINFQMAESIISYL